MARVTAATARRDPGARGRHADALVSGVAPTRAASCACGRAITQGAPCWGLEYAGGPLAEEQVVPLYGSHPMWHWFHRDCGFAF
jgi:hypothetical protein